MPKLHSSLLLVSLLGAAPAPAATVDGEILVEQRQQFREARSFLASGSLKAYRILEEQLRDYPLYPYLLHDYYRPRLAKLKEEEIGGFLERYGDLPMADDLRRAWLRLLAQRGHWEKYLEYYTPQPDTVLKCYQLLARIRTGRDAFLLEDARTLWLSGESQPPQCDSAFERLGNSDLMTVELVWQRFGLAMERGNTALADVLRRRLPETDGVWAGRWIAMHNNPAKALRDQRYEDSAIARTILLHGMNRLVRQNLDQAIARWDVLRSAFGFSAAERAGIDRALALRAVTTRSGRARELLDAMDNAFVDEEILQSRLRAALGELDWQSLLRWTEGKVPADEATRGQWLYWRGRALEAQGDPRATATYALAAKERNYYGFLAADRAALPYALNHNPLPEDLEAWQRISELPAVVRARELYLLGMTPSAWREWNHALRSMTTYQMQIAAMVAASWGWHYCVIRTMGLARAYDDLILRFPVTYEEPLRQYADKRSLDLAWVYALVHAESAFREDARSPAGALGLMQVMPMTGKETASRIGLRAFTPEKLKRADVNVPIGTAYMRQMLDHFRGNMVLATAAYNAGPGNVGRWLPRSDCVEPDVWVERIPITETRKYVQRILYYSSIYDWRLRRDVQPLRQRMAAVHPPSQAVAARDACTVAVSMN
ncbi:MAG TPA: transglycosylase SLT domain-containing protein [Gammaproteobacteria bacterium]